GNNEYKKEEREIKKMMIILLNEMIIKGNNTFLNFISNSSILGILIKNYLPQLCVQDSILNFLITIFENQRFYIQIIAKLFNFGLPNSLSEIIINFNRTPNFEKILVLLDYVFLFCLNNRIVLNNINDSGLKARLEQLGIDLNTNVSAISRKCLEDLNKLIRE
ncbi:MAG: hypothetical protein MJ252_04180, partial [archaeon]|nr:hypothetical protein [archaeon]